MRTVFGRVGAGLDPGREDFARTWSLDHHFEPAITEAPASRRGKATDNPRKLNRPAIWQDLLGKNTRPVIRRHTTCYELPHDALANWVRDNTNALNTESWLRKGHYSWPGVSEAMQDFLDPFETDCPPD